MNKEQKRIAGIIYAYASVLSLDNGGAETKEENAVVESAAKFAREQLTKIGLSGNNIPLSLQDCINAAKAAR